MSQLCVVIMAGGLGKRMRSTLPKVVHKIQNKPMLVHVIEKAKTLNPLQIMIVVGKYETVIKEILSEYMDINTITFVKQPESLGTGHAVMCCKYELEKYKNSHTLILSGDVPLLKSNTMREMCKHVMGCKLLCTKVDNPYGYGRIKITNNKFNKIVEEKDCNDEEKEINLINAGVYTFDTTILCEYIKSLNCNNAAKEYYLTDIVEIIKDNVGDVISLCELPKEKAIELSGVNTKEQLEELNKQVENKDFS